MMRSRAWWKLQSAANEGRQRPTEAPWCVQGRRFERKPRGIPQVRWRHFERQERADQHGRSARLRCWDYQIRAQDMTRPAKTKLATLADLDGRTVAARMAKDTISAIESDLSGAENITT